MMSNNFEMWKKIYENFYGIPLEYTTENVKLEKEVTNI